MNLTGIVSAYVSLAKSLAGIAIARADAPAGTPDTAPRSAAQQAGQPGAAGATPLLAEGEDVSLVAGQAVAGSGITGESDTPLPDIRRQSGAADHGSNTASRSLVGLRQPVPPLATQPLATALLAAVTRSAALPLNPPQNTPQPDEPAQTGATVPPREASAEKATARPALAGLGQSDVDDGEPDAIPNDAASHPARTPTAAKAGVPSRNPSPAPSPGALPVSDGPDIAPEEPATGQPDVRGSDGAADSTRTGGGTVMPPRSGAQPTGLVTSPADDAQPAEPDAPAADSQPPGRRSDAPPNAARATGATAGMPTPDALQAAMLHASVEVNEPADATAADEPRQDNPPSAPRADSGIGARMAGQVRSAAEAAAAPADTGMEARPAVLSRRDAPAAPSGSVTQTPPRTPSASEAPPQLRTAGHGERPQPAQPHAATVAGARVTEPADQRLAPAPEMAAATSPERNQRATAMRLELPQNVITEAMGSEQQAANPSMEAVILNAAMIPGWPAPRPFEMPQRVAQQLQRRALAAGQAEEPENTLKRGNRDEVAVQTYLANMGVKRSLLDRFRAMLKPVNQRMKILFGLAVLATQIVFTLHTVLSELESIESEEDDVEGQPGEQQRRLRG